MLATYMFLAKIKQNIVRIIQMERSSPYQYSLYFPQTTFSRPLCIH